MCFTLDYVHWWQAARSLYLLGLPVIHRRLRDNIIIGQKVKIASLPLGCSRHDDPMLQLGMSGRESRQLSIQYGCTMCKMLRAPVRCVKCFERLEELCSYRDTH